MRHQAFKCVIKTKAGTNGKQVKINQDCAFVDQKLPFGLKCYCVCDGHGLNGHIVSSFIKTHMMSTIFLTKERTLSQRLKNKPLNLSMTKCSKSFWTYSTKPTNLFWTLKSILKSVDPQLLLFSSTKINSFASMLETVESFFVIRSKMTSIRMLWKDRKNLNCSLSTPKRKPF